MFLRQKIVPLLITRKFRLVKEDYLATPTFCFRSKIFLIKTKNTPKLKSSKIPTGSKKPQIKDGACNQQANLARYSDSKNISANISNNVSYTVNTIYCYLQIICMRKMWFKKINVNYKKIFV